jgi:hypothetical protein
MSPALDLAPRNDAPRPRRAARWLSIVALSLLIHLALIDALPRWTVEPEDDEPIGEPLRATLMPLVPPAEAPKPAEAAPAPKPAPRRPVRATPPPVSVVTTFVPESMEPVPEVQVTQGEPGRSPSPATAGTAPPPPPVDEPAPAATTAPANPTTPPQSARLDYQVVSTNVKESNPIYGKGTITWAIADGRYASDLKAAANVFIFKFDVLSSHSEGGVGPGGLAPDRYLESPRRRATVATNFNRDARQSITFSSSTVVAPLLPGTQDRLSVLFQIGALLLGDPQKLVAGTAIDIPVAGVRGDVEPWRFTVRGNEAIETGVGSLSTTHLQRAPRPGTNDRTIDVWIAQSDGGYPARVLYTEPSGNTVMMTLDRISAIQ